MQRHAPQTRVRCRCESDRGHVPYTEEQRAYHRRYYYKRRQAVIDYLGGCCAVCGGVEDLQVDHVERAHKRIEIGSRLTLSSLLDELAKCQLLCAPHHREKTAEEQRGFTHGTMYAWQKIKCDCEPCTLAKWEWHDKRNAKRRTGAKGPYKTTRR